MNLIIYGEEMQITRKNKNNKTNGKKKKLNP